MTPTLLPGDNILVNKWVMGGRVFEIWDAVEGKDTEIYRLPGVSRAKRNDILVFNYPYPDKADSIVMDAYPWDKHLGWTIQEFGPLPIPVSGQTVQMDSTVMKLYRQLMVWDQKRPVTREDK